MVDFTKLLPFTDFLNIFDISQLYQIQILLISIYKHQNSQHFMC